ncbi:hypothetical protein HGM15179_004412 [Zosterops borbonicus]|uniref:Reverse transcriptase domain-containing protein n=1 Tax=Zosterops borbonicus TaxID=364589 RepID=A0A8K1GS21_9PASS|nr:hypothetical protein HGM15179_004412 [Zosterops borbonicus]
MQRLVTNASHSQWTLVTSDSPQAPILGTVLSNIFINYIEEGIKGTLSKSVDGIEPSSTVTTLEGWDGIQRDLNKLRKWAHGNLMRINKAKCKEWHLGQDNLPYQHRQGDEQIKSRPSEKDLVVLVDERLDVTQFCALTQKCVLGCIQTSVASSAKEGILPLYSALMRPQLECCIQLSGSQNKKEMNLLDQVLRCAIRMISGMYHLFYKEGQRIRILQPGKEKALE